MLYTANSHSDDTIGVSELDSSYGSIFSFTPNIKMIINKVESNVKKDINNIGVKSNINDYYIHLYNENTKKTIYGWNIYEDSIVLPYGSTNIGDKIRIAISSGDCAEIQEFIYLNDNNSGEVNFRIIQKGYTQIVYFKDMLNTKTVRGLIYDKDGNLINSFSENSNKDITTGYLQNGDYTIVMLRSNGNLWRISKLGDIKERGLIKGLDYKQFDISVEDGVVSEIYAETIPILDENRISFFEKNSTIFSTSSELASLNGLLEVRMQYKYKDRYTLDNIKNANIVFSIPNQLTFIDNSVINNNKSVNYSYNNGKLIVPINELEGVIKFTVRPNESKKVSIEALGEFIYKNSGMSSYIRETLGSVNVDINFININGVSETSSSKVMVYGIAPPNEKVSIYDGVNKVGEATSLASGKWNAEIELHNPKQNSIHNIISQVQIGLNESKQSNKLEVKYSEGTPMIKEFIMIHNNQIHDLTKAFLSGESPVYVFRHNQPFTFKIKMDNSQKIDKLFVTSKRNNEVKKIEAYYDEKSLSWIASGFFDDSNHSYVPGTLNVEYTEIFKEYNPYDIPEKWRKLKVELLRNNNLESEFLIKDNNIEFTVLITFYGENKNILDENLVIIVIQSLNL